MGLIMFDLFSRWEDITSNPNTTKANPKTTKVGIPLPCRLHQWVGHSNLVSHHLTACGLNGSANFSMWDEELWMVENINFQHLSRCHQVREILKVIQTQSHFHHTPPKTKMVHLKISPWKKRNIDPNHHFLSSSRSFSGGVSIKTIQIIALKSPQIWGPRHPVWWWPKIQPQRSRTSLQCSKTRLQGGAAWPGLCVGEIEECSSLMPSLIQ